MRLADDHVPVFEFCPVSCRTLWGRGCVAGGGGRSGRSVGFTLIELLVAIAIIAILAALLFPAVNWAVASAQKAQCTANIRKHGASVFAYTADNNGQFPKSRSSPSPSDYWTVAVAGYRLDQPSPQAGFMCPSVAKMYPEFVSYILPISYGINMCIAGTTGGAPPYGFSVPYTNRAEPFRTHDISQPSKTSLISDVAAFAYGVYSLGNQPTWFLFPHGRRQMFFFCDGHVELRTRAEIPTDFKDVFWTGGTQQQ
jgi:prepilin-type N-terminal cleavage/methylation domain-containing protein/prepilin-type processing-associated H-X9-DG protein